MFLLDTKKKYMEKFRCQEFLQNNMNDFYYAQGGDFKSLPAVHTKALWYICKIHSLFAISSA